MRKSTPMMAQWSELKARHKDALLLFRLGDFYEMFFEDAEIGAKELGITLTGRLAGKGERAPMCGVPHHSVGDYIKILVEKGYKVAICEQMENPAVAKGLVKRDVTRVITPGTYWEGAEATSPSYIVAIFAKRGEGAGVAACDLSTGEVLLAHVPAQGLKLRVIEEVSRFLPKECVMADAADQKDLTRGISKALPGVFMTSRDASSFSVATSPGEENKGLPNRAFAGLLSYIKETQGEDLSHLKEPRFYLEEGFMEIDNSTAKNLELFERLQGGTHGSLVWVLDKCCTPMGSRLLKQWVGRPLRDTDSIRNRLAAVTEAYENAAFRLELRSCLSQIKDLERLVTKIAYKSCDARDLVALASSLEAIPGLRKACEKGSSSAMQSHGAGLDEVWEAVSAIRSALVDEPPATVTGGGMIRQGHDPELDQLRDLAAGGKQWVLDLETRERERTGIKTLKVGYNRVFGYYIEITKSYLNCVPQEYIRKQTLVSAERFVTPELRDKESAILGADERLCREEYRIFCDVRDFVSGLARRIQETGRLVAQIDVLSNLSEIAHSNGYVCPQVDATGAFTIENGRHPVLEKVLPRGTFVPNDLSLDREQRVMIITGPNMGGKSTYCRQAALIAIMAQIGSYVPCKACTISALDRVFARVGAYDDLVLGQSTFMVEMTEVSRILRGATRDSLVILDEIGRGTGTFDGLAVAWAVVEHLADVRTAGSMALVATHYKELTLLSDLKPGISNYHVTVRRSGGDITFLRKVVRGVSEGSFGIEVSAMAGLPEQVVERARQILVGLESEARRKGRLHTGILGQAASRSPGLLYDLVPGQESLFGSNPGDSKDMSAGSVTPAALAVVTQLAETDLDSLSPLDALNLLYDMKKKIAREE